VSDENAPMYVPSGTNQIPDFVGALSPMLTVWRKLHLEFDSMTAPPTTGLDANFASGSVTKIIPNTPAAGRSIVGLLHVNFHGEPGKDLFAGGKLEIVGVGTYKVTNSATAVISQQAAVTLVDVDSVLAGVTNGSPARLYDDDDRYLQYSSFYESLINLPLPVLPADARSTECVQAMQYRFTPAYITLVDVNSFAGWNTQRTVPFQRNADSQIRIGDLYLSAFDAGNLQLKGTDRPGFWAHSVAFGYQAGPSDDGEPEVEFPDMGETPKRLNLIINGFDSFGFSVVWLEGIRDNVFGEYGKRRASDPTASQFMNPDRAAALAHQYNDLTYGVISHEIGHAPGKQWALNDHGENGLMQPGAAAINAVGFFPRTITRFRSTTSWTR
jgi:hypothetical protein